MPELLSLKDRLKLFEKEIEQQASGPPEEAKKDRKFSFLSEDELRRMKAGLEETRFFFLKPAQWVFLFFFVFFGFFGFFLYICLEERFFRVFLLSRILLGASRL